MIRRPPRSTRTDTLFPYTTLFRSQQAPLDAKERWDPDFAKRQVIQADLRRRLPGLSITLGGTTSIDVTRKGVDKAYGLRRLSEVRSGERRVGKECVSTCRSRWSPYHSKKKKYTVMKIARDSV